MSRDDLKKVQNGHLHQGNPRSMNAKKYSKKKSTFKKLKKKKTNIILIIKRINKIVHSWDIDIFMVKI